MEARPTRIPRLLTSLERVYNQLHLPTFSNHAPLLAASSCFFLHKRSSSTYNPLTLPQLKPNTQHTSQCPTWVDNLSVSRRPRFVIQGQPEHLLTLSFDRHVQVTRPPPPSSPTLRSLTSSRPPTTSRELSTPLPRKFPDLSEYFFALHVLRILILTESSTIVNSAVTPQSEKSTTQKIGDAVSGTSLMLNSIRLFTY
jgi:hypothetical protein